MSEKSINEISIKTVIIAVVVGVLIIALIVSGIKNKNKNTDKGNVDKNINNDNTNIESVIEENPTAKIYEENKQNIINILKSNSNALEYFKAIEIKIEDSKYIASFEHVYPVIYFEDEYAELKENKIMYIDDIEYEVKFDGNSEYGYIEVENVKYELQKNEQGYMFTAKSGNLENPAICNYETIEIYLDNNTVINDTLKNKKYTIIENEATEWLNKTLENDNLRLSYSDDNGLMIEVR